MSGTGVVGLALGSGSGWLERAFGLVCDNLLAATVVTADGRVVTASEQSEPELFWGLRGGGGNFGVVTDMTLRLHPLGSDRVRRHARCTRPRWPASWCAPTATSSPPRLTRWAAAWRSSPRRPRSSCPSRRGASRRSASCAATPARPPTARTPTAALRELPYLAVDMLGEMPYVAVQQLLDPPNQKGAQNYWTADFLAELPDEAIDTLVGHGHPTRVAADADHPHPRRRGAVPRSTRTPWPSASATRRGTCTSSRCGPIRPTPRPTSPTPRDLAAAMKPWTTGRAYLNFIGDEGVGRVEAAFGPEKYARLSRLKRDWDPTNLFRHNQNIAPAPVG